MGFECRSIIPYIRKYGKHPVTGAPLKQEDLIPLTFHKNAEGLAILLFFPSGFISFFSICIVLIKMGRYNE